MIEFGVLGPLLVRRNGQPVDMTATMLKRLQALLLVYGGEPVHLDTLADALWCGDPPPSARKSLHVYAHRLRRALGDDERLTFGRGGYSLTVAPDELDLYVFQRLVDDANASNDPETAYSLLSEALALWRGDAYADITDLEPVNVERHRLAEHRWIAFEARVAMGLEIGHDDGLVAELKSAVTASPYRERLRGQLMLALCRAGRQAEALEVYRETHDVLGTELGLEPTTELQQLHQQILRRDPALAGPGSLVQLAAPPTPRLLPRDITDFTGRLDDVERLDAVAGGGTGHTALITAVEGTAGVGKTALAVHWGHRSASRFPDGQLYVNLRGYDSGSLTRPIEALTHFLRVLGVRAEKLPTDEEDATALYRSMLSGKKMLIVLDNARTADQVRPLLPSDPGCFGLVTSRNQLSGLIAHDGAQRITIGLLSSDEASVLLRRLLGADRVDAEPESTAALVELCARLPLALRIAAAQLADEPSLPISKYLAELSEGVRLATLSIDGDEHLAVKAVLDQSCQALRKPERRALRLLGLVPGPDVTPAAMAALADMTVEDAQAVLDTLVTYHLLDQHLPGRYTFHDLIREYARISFEQSGESSAEPLRRLFLYLKEGAANATALLDPGSSSTGSVSDQATAQEAIAWLEAERANLVAAVTGATAAGLPEMACAIAQPLWTFFFVAGHTSDWITTFEIALTAIDGRGDDTVKYYLLNALGSAYVRAGRYQQAIDVHKECVAAREAMGDLIGVSRSRSNLAMSYERLGRYEEALIELTEALRVYQRTGERGLECHLLGGNIPNVLNRMGRHEDARDHVLQAIPLVREVGTPSIIARTVQNLGNTYRHMGQPDIALGHLREALELARRLGDRRLVALTVGTIGEAQRDLGDFTAALTSIHEGLESMRQMGLRANESEYLNGIGATHLAMGQPDRARAAYEEALEIAEELGLPHQHARALVGLGKLCREQDHGEARKHFTEALAILGPVAPIEAAEIRTLLAGLQSEESAVGGPA